MAPLNNELQKAIQEAVDITKNNTGLIVVIAVDYGGQWDILEATKKIYKQGNVTLLR